MGELVDRVTIFEMERFLESPGWQEVKSQYEDILSKAKDYMLEEKDKDEMLRFQGRGEAIRDLLIVPEQILEALIEDKKAENKEDNFNEMEDLDE